MPSYPPGAARPQGMPPKDPHATLDYTVDWSDWLAAGETLASVTWTVPAGLTQADAAQTATQAQIWLTGGTAGASYTVACRVTTSAGRIDERSMLIAVAER
jgi:hypothetical protein